jgi:hypothetical protein
MTLSSVVLFCKVFLTGVSTYRYCSENWFTPVCGVAELYFFLLVGSMGYTICRKAKPSRIQETEETVRVRELEEGLLQTFSSFKQE